MAGLFLDFVLVKLGNALQIAGFEVGVELDAFRLFLEFKNFLEMRMIDFQNDAGIHLDEAAIGIVSKALIACGLGDTGDGVRVEPQIQHRVHHAGHGGARAGAHRNQQGLCGIAKARAGEFAHAGKRGFHSGFQIGGIGLRRSCRNTCRLRW